jgi:hypothetical protein
MRILKVFGSVCLMTVVAGAQTATRSGPWELEESHSTAGLRGIHSAGNGVVWAGGTDGTVLRSKDGGHLWQPCAIPPNASTLDFGPGMKRLLWFCPADPAICLASTRQPMAAAAGSYSSLIPIRATFGMAFCSRTGSTVSSMAIQRRRQDVLTMHGLACYLPTMEERAGSRLPTWSLSLESPCSRPVIAL